jgi:hypothetical protein
VYVYNFETIDHGTKILILDQSRGVGSGSGSGGNVTLLPAALPTATSGRLGLVRVGSGLAITPEGTLSIDLTAANLPLGSASSIGGVRQGAGVTIAGDGSLSVTNAGIFGINQTWQNVTLSRFSGISYTNSTGRPIMVSVYNSGVDNGISLTCVVGGETVSGSGGGAGGDGRWQVNSSFIVPNATTYSVTFTTGALGTTLVWHELR